MAETSSGSGGGQAIECVKMKIGSFVDPERLLRLEAAVRTVTKIMTRTTILLKAWYLRQDGVVEITDELLSMCFSIVQGESRTVRASRDDDGKLQYSSKAEARKELFVDLKNVYDTAIKMHCEPSYLSNDLSLSKILLESASQLKTNFKTNVVSHFDKYVRCLVYEELFDMSLRGAELKEHKKVLANVVNHLMYGDECPLGHVEWVKSNAFRVPHCPDASKRDSHIDRHPWVYMRSMVDIVAYLEGKRKSNDVKRKPLPSPFVLCRSAIPRNIRLATGGLVQLMMDPEDVDKFVKFYREHTGNAITMRSKADLCADFSKVHGREPLNDAEEATFQTWKWRYILSFESKRAKRVLSHKRRDGEWRFFNTAFTDGVSIAFCVTPASQLRVMDMQAKAKRRAAAKVAARESKNAGEFESTAAINLQLHKVVSLDPGKGNLATLSDGTRIAKFTSRERDHVVGEHGMRRTRAAIIDNTFDEEGKSVAEVQELMKGGNSRSCEVETFDTYVRLRLKYESFLESCYARAVFRNHRFRSYCRRKSWTDMTIDAIDAKFSGPCRSEPHAWMRKNAINDPVYKRIISEARKDTHKQLVIAYGNWGRSTTLRGNKPTPGIGLRRAIHKRIPTYTQCEHYTSQVCPCCHHRCVDNAVLLESHRRVHEKHSLLVCQDHACECRFFQRDVLASVNILYKAHHMIMFGSTPPAFVAESTKSKNKRAGARKGKPPGN
jgi:hypothetical protein